MVTVDLDTAYLIAKVFCPANPNKMRKADPRVVAAAHEFKRATHEALALAGDLRAMTI